jgi:hypothetical protein
MPLTRKQQISIIIPIVAGIIAIFVIVGSGYFSSTLPYPTEKSGGPVMGTGYSCGGSPTPISVVYAQGFANITRVYPDKLPGFFEFVLRPNSTGNITMLYNFGGNNSTVGNGVIASGRGTTQYVLANVYQRNMSGYFGNVDITKVTDDAGNKTENDALVYLSRNNIQGMSVYPSSISNVTNSVVKVTYTVKTDDTVKEGTYLLGLNICPGELVTIGNEQTKMPLPWDNFSGWY